MSGLSPILATALMVLSAATSSQFALAADINVEQMSAMLDNLAALKNTELNYISDFVRPEQTQV
jgi:hypothetical protein